ncbi:hypothetical protein E3E12_00460 [Formicincola oecophyllae]|uniref:Uncharacterized protein n=1 Tax=Formicincola oecophyllae TaxID=2558361 RepID=A0A4Y6U8Z8_9PROT|nr:hypothetical protein [Formicincola oecophyllae]QDH12926.1 hypothetical protein E3E12_00460 [Formicincola oecophyllae]
MSSTNMKPAISREEARQCAQNALEKAAKDGFEGFWQQHHAMISLRNQQLEVERRVQVFKTLAYCLIVVMTVGNVSHLALYKGVGFPGGAAWLSQYDIGYNLLLSAISIAAVVFCFLGLRPSPRLEKLRAASALLAER